MGCNKSSTVEPTTISPDDTYKPIGKKLCSFCKTRQGTFHLLDCHCWICHSCLVQTLESLLKHSDIPTQTITCPKCKKNVGIKEFSLECGCVVAPGEVKSNDQDSSVFFNFNEPACSSTLPS